MKLDKTETSLHPCCLSPLVQQFEKKCPYTCKIHSVHIKATVHHMLWNLKLYDATSYIPRISLSFLSFLANYLISFYLDHRRSFLGLWLAPFWAYIILPHPALERFTITHMAFQKIVTWLLTQTTLLPTGLEAPSPFQSSSSKVVPGSSASPRFLMPSNHIIKCFIFTSLFPLFLWNFVSSATILKPLTSQKASPMAF